MKGLVLKTNYERNLKGKWEEVGKELDILYLDANYWEDSHKYDFSSSHRLILNCGLLWSYTSVSPTRLQKINYKKVAYMYQGRGKDVFDKLEGLGDDAFKTLRAKAKKEALKNGIDFEKEACFISSSDIQGFYFPNLEKVRVIAFIGGNPYLLSDRLIDRILSY